MIAGVGGMGGAVHAELHARLVDPADELRAAAPSMCRPPVESSSEARGPSADAHQGADDRCVGIVLGGALDKELRDFEAAQARRREVGAPHADFAVLVVEATARSGWMRPCSRWFADHDGHMASLFGTESRLYVYDAHRRPRAGRRGPETGSWRIDAVRGRRRPLLRVLDGLHAAPSA